MNQDSAVRDFAEENAASSIVLLCVHTDPDVFSFGPIVNVLDNISERDVHDNDLVPQNWNLARLLFFSRNIFCIFSEVGWSFVYVIDLN